uniref:Dynein intermediate chain 1, axonemal n=1 Tax=Eptatretus burgeri TaxID=7764 RepID=A0A8C4R3R3_EPTBU
MELDEDITRTLTANNPQAPRNIIYYSYHEQSFKVNSKVDQLAVHFILEGDLIFKGSNSVPQRRSKGMIANIEEYEVGEAEEQNGQEMEKDEVTDVKKSSLEYTGTHNVPKIANQFNYNERASQTFNNPQREQASQTEPPPQANFSDTVNQWKIYDVYQEELLKQKATKEQTPPTKPSHHGDCKKAGSMGFQINDMSKIAKAAKIMERVVNMNTYDEIAQDYKYFEDASDEFQDMEGTLLPLWHFHYEKAKKLAVTALCWNPHYEDLIAAGYGSFDMNQKPEGMLVLYSFKNPSFPEETFSTESGVLCMDFHPTFCHMAVLGCYDGSLIAISLRGEKKQPTRQCVANKGRHTDPVWQVKWQKDDMDKNLNFFSISSDGRIVSWTILKNDFVPVEVIQLTDDPSSMLCNPQALHGKKNFEKKMASTHYIHQYYIGTVWYNKCEV